MKSKIQYNIRKRCKCSSTQNLRTLNRNCPKYGQSHDENEPSTPIRQYNNLFIDNIGRSPSIKRTNTTYNEVNNKKTLN